MPNKSSRSRNHRNLRKINRDKQWSADITTRQPVTAQTSTPGIVARKVDSQLSSPTSSAANPYPYVRAELKSIGTLTGVILLIMVVLYWLLR